LVAGAAFADFSIGGSFGYKATIIKQNDAKQEIRSSAESTDAYINVDFSGEKFGGRVRFYANPHGIAGVTDGPYWTGAPFAFAWWQPIDQIKFQLGLNPDGNWGAAQITGWGFHASAQSFVAIDADSDWDNNNPYGRNWNVARSKGFYPGFNDVGALLSIIPVDFVSINIGIPLSGKVGDKADGTADPAYNAYRKVHANVGFGITDVGKVNVSFIGTGGTINGTYASAGTLYASFYLSAIENVGMDFGVSYQLPWKNIADKVEQGNVGVGYGLKVSAGDFGVKFRLGADLNPATDYTLGFVVLPSYNFGVLSAYLNVGMGMKMGHYTPAELDMDWYVNPYVQVPAGGLNFWTGFKVGGKYSLKPGVDGTVAWAIPIGVSVGF